MQPGGALLAFFFVLWPVVPLTSHAAKLDILTHLEANATLTTLGTMCHCI